MAVWYSWYIETKKDNEVKKKKRKRKVQVSTEERIEMKKKDKQQLACHFILLSFLIYEIQEKNST